MRRRRRRACQSDAETPPKPRGPGTGLLIRTAREGWVEPHTALLPLSFWQIRSLLLKRVASASGPGL